MRLGLALGKSRQEIRALPYPEYKDWQLFYVLEPWGWADAEYRTAAIIAKLHNVNVQKKSDLKEPRHFMRDMADLLLKELEKRIVPDLSSLSQEERDELIRKSMREAFGV